MPAEILEKSSARVSLLLLLLAFFYISRRSRAVGLSRFPLLAGEWVKSLEQIRANERERSERERTTFRRKLSLSLSLSSFSVIDRGTLAREKV